MNSDDLLEILKMVHEVFPVPEGDEQGEFKGTHAILMDRQTGKLCIGIWVLSNNKIYNQPIIFEGEPINMEVLLGIKEVLEMRELASKAEELGCDVCDVTKEEVQ